MQDIQEIRLQIERWCVYRDALLWDEFRKVWAPDGIMKATWTEGSYEDFIRITEEGSKHGLNILHDLGASAITVRGGRATAMTRIQIFQRAELDGVVCDVTSIARHYDLWRKDDGKWGLVFRTTIADKDRIDPVAPGEKVVLDKSILELFPREYQHLAYLQTKVGYNVNRDCPVLRGGPALDALYKKGADWLAEG